MSIVVNTNVNSLLAQQYLTGNQSRLSDALNKLSSGLRINDAKDDAAGLSIAEHMTETILALRQGSRNANDGVSLVQVAQNALMDSLNSLQRMRQLASQGASGTYGTTDLANMDKEFQALKGEIQRVSAVTVFNNISLLANSTGSLSIQVGPNNTSNDSITITLTKGDTTTLGVNADVLTSSSAASTALGHLDTAIGDITTGLAQLGANEANLLAAISIDDAISNSFDAAKSRIMDTDFALESSNMAKFSILNQSNVAMLAQANSTPQLVLQLLRQ
jgi:flagellin